MALTKCPDCGGTLSFQAVACPHCGCAAGLGMSAPLTKTLSGANAGVLRAKNAWLGCAGIIVLLIAIGAAVVFFVPSISIEGTTGKIHAKEYANGTADEAGFDIAEKVYRAASGHPELHEVDVEVELIVGGGLVDKYGKEVPGPYLMGTVPVRDLEEVRKYADEGSYAIHNKEEYAAQIRDLQYAYLFEK